MFPNLHKHLYSNDNLVHIGLMIYRKFDQILLQDLII